MPTRSAKLYGADFALEGEGEQHVVEGVDQVTIALLRAFDDGKELVQLAIARRLGVLLLEALDQAAALGHLLGALPGVHPEQPDQDDQADRKCFKTNG